MAKKRDISHLTAEEQAKIEARRAHDRERYRRDPQKWVDKAQRWREENPERWGDFKREWEMENAEKMKSVRSTWRKNNLEKSLGYTTKWQSQNRDKINASEKARYHSNDNSKLRRRLRNGISRLMAGQNKGTKAGSAVRDLGCTTEELRAYLEAQFRLGMSWDNYGKGGWEIDHITPLASFDLTDREQFLKACHYTNLQPLWHHENRAKGDKLVVDGEMIRGRDLKVQGHKPEDNDNNTETKVHVS